MHQSILAHRQIAMNASIIRRKSITRPGERLLAPFFSTSLFRQIQLLAEFVSVKPISVAYKYFTWQLPQK
ncbi:hypothetical protein T08_8227 [Trichinella sp. T8]|nr:hypothetical protein T08_8227 [Trichinella sp. T8]